MIPNILTAVLMVGLARTGSTYVLPKPSCKEYIMDASESKEYKMHECYDKGYGYIMWDPVASMKIRFPLKIGPDQELCFRNDEYLVVYDENNKKLANRRQTEKEWKKCVDFDDNDIVLDCRTPAKYLKTKHMRYGTFIKFAYRQKPKKQ